MTLPIPQRSLSTTPIALPPLSVRPLVSVLLPNYNYARFLPHAIESVQAQSYDNWELLVCDDGSTDNSCEVAERYSRLDRRITVLRQTVERHCSVVATAQCGPSGARHDPGGFRGRGPAPHSPDGQF